MPKLWNGLHIHPVIEDHKCLYWVGMAKDVTAYVEEVSSGIEAVIATVKDSLHKMSADLKSV